MLAYLAKISWLGFLNTAVTEKEEQQHLHLSDLAGFDSSVCN